MFAQAMSMLCLMVISIGAEKLGAWSHRNSIAASNHRIEVKDRMRSPNLEETVGFLGLPEDIGRVIFELAARLDTETCRACALVSRKVNAW